MPSAAVAALMLCCVLSACGGGDREKSDAVVAAPSAPVPDEVAPATVAQARSADDKQSRKRALIARRSSATALPAPRGREAGAARRACGGVTAERVRVRYLPEARAGASSRDRLFLKVAAHPSEQLRRSPSFPYLAARVYAMSVSPGARAGAYAGCAFELSMKKNVKESGR
jgi:hypothetical protein